MSEGLLATKVNIHWVLSEIFKIVPSKKQASQSKQMRLRIGTKCEQLINEKKPICNVRVKETEVVEIHNESGLVIRYHQAYLFFIGTCFELCVK
jgi:hypothetical protein